MSASDHLSDCPSGPHNISQCVWPTREQAVARIAAVRVADQRAREKSQREFPCLPATT